MGAFRLGASRDSRERFAVKYYVVAMLFLVFEVEVVFLFAWGVVLIVGLVYEWRPRLGLTPSGRHDAGPYRKGIRSPASG
jgi:NADH:ubiquinone oxidoreductase subunit 3 (subunit A)